MTKPIQNSPLYTSLDYHNALKATDKIKRAVSLIEGGNAVVDFSRYVKAYTELVEKLVSTNDQGNDTNSKMEVAHNKLSKELQGLERRIVAASAKIGVTPPSKDLMQILKINVLPAEEKPTQKLTWTQTAKYSAYLSAGGLSAYAFYKFYDSIRKLPETIKHEIFEDPSIRQFLETFKKTVLENEFLKQIPGKLPGATKTVIQQTVRTGTTAMNVVDNSIKAGQTYVTGLGQIVNQGRKILNATTGIEVPPGDPTEQGFSFLVNLGVARYVWGMAKPYVMPFLGPLGPVLPIDMAIDGAIVCNTIYPNCTSSIIDTANATVHFAKDHPTELYAIGAVVVPSVGIYHRDIAEAFNSAKGSKLEAMSYFGVGKYLATQAIDSAYPGLIANYSNEYPLTAKVSDWGGTLGNVAGPWIASYSGIAKAWGQAAENAIPIPPAGPLVTDEVLNAIGKARKAAFARGYQKAFTVTSIALGVLGTVSPLIANSWNNGILGQHPYITTTSTTGLIGVTAAAKTASFLYSTGLYGAPYICTISLGVGLVTGTAIVATGVALNALGSYVYNKMYEEPKSLESDLLSSGMSVHKVIETDFKNEIPSTTSKSKPVNNPGGGLSDVFSSGMPTISQPEFNKGIRSPTPKVGTNLGAPGHKWK